MTTSNSSASARALVGYLLAGTLFGVILIKGEVISWFRIYEMFRFDSFRMYGIIASAVMTAMVSLQVIRRFEARSLAGEPITLPAKEMGAGTRYWLGGTLFGIGWGLVGACPGPLFALIGGGVSVMIVVLAAALCGTMLYGVTRRHLPH